jgi:hypothetical protein
MRRLVILAIAAALLPLSARADTGSAGCGYQGCYSGVLVPGHPGTGGGAVPTGYTGGTGPTCSYEQLQTLAGDLGRLNPSPPPGPGYWLLGYCSDGTVIGPYWVPTNGGGPTPPAPTPAQLAEQALASFVFPRPHPQTAPPSESFVNVPTWLWVSQSDWRPLSATASVGGVSATVTAEPVAMRWEMGNGDTVTCSGPGLPYDESYEQAHSPGICAYTYDWRAGQSYVVSVRILYHAYWSSTTGQGGDFGTIPGPATAMDMPIHELIAVFTDPSKP